MVTGVLFLLSHRSPRLLGPDHARLPPPGVSPGRLQEDPRVRLLLAHSASGTYPENFFLGSILKSWLAASFKTSKKAWLVPMSRAFVRIKLGLPQAAHLKHLLL